MPFNVFHEEKKAFVVSMYKLNWQNSKWLGKQQQNLSKGIISFSVKEITHYPGQILLTSLFLPLWDIKLV